MRSTFAFLFIGVSLAAWAAELPEPETVWEYDCGAKIKASPVFFPSVTDPTGVIANTEDGRIVLISGKGELLWEHDLSPEGGAGTWADASAAVGDLDGDGTAEIVTAMLEGEVVVLNADGTERWRFPLEGTVTDWSSPCLPDLDGDGACEILLGDQSGWMTCLSGDGKRIWRLKVDDYQVSAAAFIKDPSGFPDKIIYGTENDHMVALSPQGELLWVAQHNGQFGRTAPTAADLDGDGDYEVGVITSFNNPDSRLWMFDANDGSIQWTAKLNLHGYPAVTMVDIDNDGTLEVVLANRSNTVYCFNGDGTERWSTYTGGNAICWAPAVADVTGDGRCEVIASTTRSNERGKAWFVISDQGALLGEYALPGGGPFAPMVADLDRDGRLDIVLAGTDAGIVRCVTFGGKTDGARIEWASHRYDAQRQACVPAKQVSDEAPAVSEPAPLKAGWAAPVVWGPNNLKVEWPEAVGQRVVIEVSASDTLGRRVTYVEDTSPAELPETLPVDLVGKGSHTVAVRVWDPSDWSGCAYAWSATVKQGGFKSFATRAARQLDSLAHTADALVAQAPGTARMLRERRAQRMGALDQLQARAETVGLEHAPDADALVKAIRDFSAGVDEDVALARIASEINTSHPGLPFAVWKDPNPWDLTPALLEGVSPSGDLAVELPLYLGEYESLALSLVNLEPVPVFLQVRAPAETRKAVLFYEPIDTLGRDGGFLPDALAELNSAKTLRLAPGEARRLWLTVNGKVLEAGANALPLDIVTLAGTEDRIPVTIRANALALDLRDAPVYRVCNWSSPGRLRSLDRGIDAFLAAKEHGMNVSVLGVPTPGWGQDGKRATVDWQGLDADVELIGPDGFLIISGQGIAAPPGTAWGGAEHVKAQREWLSELAAHLESKGFGMDEWALYPVDEPGLFGGTKILEYVKIARHLKEAMPGVPVYANPSGNVTTENMKPMVPLTDVWCPEQGVLRRQPELAEFFLATGKPVWSYEAPPDSKTQLPLGYYRANPWMALQLGLHGTGFWTQLYSGSHFGGNDMWFAGKSVLFGANYEVGGNEVISRRWEAFRDGVEDVRAFLMLREAADAARAKGVHAGLVARADELLGAEVEHATRKAWPCGDPTRFLRDYEMDLDEIQRMRAEAAQLTLSLQGP
jgi:FG-GAP-like repeat